AAARRLPRGLSAADLRGRTDLRALPLVTIDGENARDFDDAVLVEALGAGFRLTVAVADVAHYVRADDVIDREARTRGTSVSFPDRVLPMLPEALSNDLCSLQAGEDRLVQAVRMEFDAAGRLRAAEFHDAVMRSAARLTYTEVARALACGDAAARGRVGRAGGPPGPRAGLAARPAHPPPPPDRGVHAGGQRSRRGRADAAAHPGNSSRARAARSGAHPGPDALPRGLRPSPPPRAREGHSGRLPGGHRRRGGTPRGPPRAPGPPARHAAGPLRRRAARALRACLGRVHALHVPHPALSRPRGAPAPAVRAQRRRAPPRRPARHRRGGVPPGAGGRG